MSRLRPVVAIAVVSLLLAGCAPEPEPVPTATATPEPTATAEAAVRPNPVFDLTCADVFSVADVQKHLAVKVSVSGDETRVPSDEIGVTQLQRGGLSCSWDSDPSYDSFFETRVDVLLLPDAQADFAERAAGLDESWSIDGADQAAGQCERSSDDSVFGGFCTAVALAGTEMIELLVTDWEGGYTDLGPLDAAVRELLTTAVERLQAAAVVDQRWTAPESAAASGDLCATLGAAFLSTLGVDGLAGGAVDAVVAGSSACSYELQSGAFPTNVVRLTAVHSGAWAAAIRPTHPELGDPWEERVTAGGALWWLSPNGESVQARAAIGGDLVTVSFLPQEVGQSAEQAQAAITAFMEEFAEAPPGT